MADNAATKPAKQGAELDKVKDAPLNSNKGRTVIDDVVVSKIAGIAAREVSGVHDLGGGAARMMGALRDTVNAGPNIQQGVDVEVGETEAAVDVAIVAEYGVAIHELAEAIRQNIIEAVESMTGLSVAEVNVTIHDIYLPKNDDDEQAEIAAAPRVS